MAVRPGKVGVALEGSEADVVDEQGKSVRRAWVGAWCCGGPILACCETVWGDPARYERDWQQIPGCYVTGDVA